MSPCRVISCGKYFHSDVIPAARAYEIVRANVLMQALGGYHGPHYPNPFAPTLGRILRGEQLPGRRFRAAVTSRPRLILRGITRTDTFIDELFSSSGAGVSHGRAGAHSEAQWDRYPECSFRAPQSTPSLCWRAERENSALREGLSPPRSSSFIIRVTPFSDRTAGHHCSSTAFQHGSGRLLRGTWEPSRIFFSRPRGARARH